MQLLPDTGVGEGVGVGVWVGVAVTVGLIFGIVWLFRKRPYWLMAGWGLHILVDIPTHAETFFPTPFLWPVSSFHVNGISWGNPVIFFPNLVLLIVAYAFWYLSWKRKRHDA